MIKICHITTDSGIGGTEKTIQLLLGGMDKNRFCHCLVVLKKRGPLNEFCDARGIPNRALSLPSWKGILGFFSLRSFFKKEMPDLLLSYLFHSNLLARFLGFFQKIPVICGQRNVDFWRKKFHSLLDRWTHPLCVKIISNSKAGKERLTRIERIPSQKINVVYNGVEVPAPLSNEEWLSNRNRFGIGEKEFLFLCPASFQPKKGHLDLLRAFEQFFPRYPQARLFLCGEGKEKDKIIQFINHSGMTKRVSVLQPVHPIIPLMQVSDALILPSLWEGVPNVILEAFACKKAVIATRTGGIPEIVRHKENGILTEPGETREIVSAMELLIKDPLLAEKLATRGFELIVRNFTVTGMIEKFSDLLEGSGK